MHQGGHNGPNEEEAVLVAERAWGPEVGLEPGVGAYVGAAVCAKYKTINHLLLSYIDTQS